MKSPYASELEPNQTIQTSFLVLAKDVRQKKSGEPYLSLTLGDRTGEVDAKMWDNVVEVMDTFDRDDFVKVKGVVQLYHNRPQITVHRVARIADSEVQFADYFPASQRDPEEMWAELAAIIAGVNDPHIRRLLEAVTADPEIASRFRAAPAAKQIHHNFLGGLLEHVLSLCGLAKVAAAHYGNVDLDYLIAAAVLHDIGKIYELSYERGFSYTAEGQLLGHIVIGLRIVGEKLAAIPGFPPRVRTLIEHMVVSHHGQLDFGSPKVPQFREAILFHYLDDMDSKMECTRALVEKDRAAETEFTPYAPSLERSLLKKDVYLGTGAPKPAAAAPAPVEAKPSSGGNPVLKPGSLFGDKLAGALGRPVK